MKNVGIILLWIIWSALCLFTVPIYLVLYPFVWLISGFKHVPWWWALTDHIENKLPVPKRKTWGVNNG